MFRIGLNGVDAGGNQDVPFAKLHFRLHGLDQAGSQPALGILRREESGCAFFDETLNAGFDSAEGVVHRLYCIVLRNRAPIDCNFYPGLIRYTD
jgi:hypothetical protein